MVHKKLFFSIFTLSCETNQNAMTRMGTMKRRRLTV
jgi:hypothetical protein